MLDTRGGFFDLDIKDKEATLYSLREYTTLILSRFQKHGFATTCLGVLGRYQPNCSRMRSI
jgi:hypothetical protein